MYKGSKDLVIFSGMSEYTLPSQLNAEKMFGSQELKQPRTESDTEPQPFFNGEWSTDWDLQHQHHLGSCQKHTFSEPEGHAESDSAFELEFWGFVRP